MPIKNGKFLLVSWSIDFLSSDIDFDKMIKILELSSKKEITEKLLCKENKNLFKHCVHGIG